MNQAEYVDEDFLVSQNKNAGLRQLFVEHDYAKDPPESITRGFNGFMRTGLLKGNPISDD